MKWPLASLVLLNALLAAPSQAKPPTPVTATRQAEDLNLQAKQAFRDGQFDQAADLFMQVYDLALTPNAVFNAARAREQAKKLPEARALLELYLKIEKTPAGLADGQAHLKSIDAAIAAQAQADADARGKVEAAANDANRQATAARAELDRQKAEKSRQDAAAAQRKTSDGLVVLPPAGTTDEDTEKVAREVQSALQREAQDAGLGIVVPVTDYLRAEQNRPVVGVAAACDFRCRLEVARGLGAAWAVTTTLRQDGKDLRVRLVLWQTADAAELAAVEASGLTLPGLSLRGQRLAGELLNGVRRFALVPVPPPAGATGSETATVALSSDPPGALASLDDLDIGPTPLTLRPTAGLHRLRLSLPGFHPRAGSFMALNRPHKLAVSLPPQLPPEAPPAIAALPVPVAAAPAVAPPVSAVASPPATEVKKSAETEPPTAKPAEAKSAKGFVWGIVPHLEGGLAMLTDAQQQTTADLNWGAGAFVHMSRAVDGEVPLVSWVGGARYQSYAGMLTSGPDPAAKPSGVAVWTGVLFPRFGGLCASVNYNHVTVHSGQPGFDYFTGQLRILHGHDLFYSSIGADFMLKSLRPASQYDDVQSGPLLRLTLEIGLNIGDTPLSK